MRVSILVRSLGVLLSIPFNVHRTVLTTDSLQFTKVKDQLSAGLYFGKSGVRTAVEFGGRVAQARLMLAHVSAEQRRGRA